MMNRDGEKRLKKEQIYEYSVESTEEDWFKDHTTLESETQTEAPTEEYPRRQEVTSASKPEEKPDADADEAKGPENWKRAVGVACLILGVIVSMLFKTYQKTGAGPPVSGRSNRLAEMAKIVTIDRNRLQADLNKAREVIREFEERAAKGQDESVTIKNQLTVARQEAGLTAVRGPGIIIKLNDSNRKPQPGDDPNYYIVHDVDLMALLNELKGAGAEAMSINEQRIVVNTAVRCVGPTITVNTVRLAPPYIVKAIGPPDNLETGLRYTGGFMDSMSPNIHRGVNIQISRSNDIEIPAYKGSLINRYAKTYEPEKKDEP